VAPGTQTPVQPPAWQTYGQLAVVCHTPVESHVRALLPEHWCDPGTQLPEQMPAPVHTYGHVVVDCHAPVVSHVCTTVPLQVSDLLTRCDRESDRSRPLDGLVRA
jgi:hypothetical protein